MLATRVRQQSLLCRVLPVLMALPVLFATRAHAANEWSYNHRADLRPSSLVMSLDPQPPDDATFSIPFRGHQQLYAQLRYGSENSRRVALVVDRLENGEFDLYLDTDRDREVTPLELVRGTGRDRVSELDAEIMVADEPLQSVRRIKLRLGITGKRLSVATLGCIEGEAGLDENAVAVRRIDGDANGLFSDARDRVMLDLDRNGQWDAVREQFPFQPILRVQSKRYGLRADRIGEKLQLEPITGTGTLLVEVASLPESAKTIAFEAIVYADDGSAYAQRERGEPLVVPTGRYTLGGLTLTIDVGEKNPWHFVFSRSSTIRDKHWISVGKDQTVKLEAVGKARFKLQVNNDDPIVPGEFVRVDPRFYTQDGLLINMCARGKQMGSFDYGRTHNRCDMKLTTSDGSVVASEQSGFA